jgi:hypothetical protein
VLAELTPVAPPAAPPAPARAIKPILLTSFKDRQNPSDRYSSVVFVCDGSGVMRGETFARLQTELQKAVDDLKPDQSFNIAFFRDQWKERPMMALTKNEMLRATDENKQLAKKFIQAMQAGSDKPDINAQEALELAFRLRPEIIYLVSGSTLSQRGVWQIIGNAWKNAHTQHPTVYTVGLFPPNLKIKDRAAAEKALQGIADQGHGQFVPAEAE